MKRLAQWGVRPCQEANMQDRGYFGKAVAYALVIAVFACAMAALGRLFIWIVGA